MPVDHRHEAEVREARNLRIEAQRLIDDPLVTIEAIVDSVDAVQRSVAAQITADRDFDPSSGTIEVSDGSGSVIDDKPEDRP